MRKSFVWLALAVASFGTAATAAPLNLVLQPAPDLASQNIMVNYDATTLAFSAIGDSAYINDPATFLFGTFKLLAQIDNLGNLLSGTLDITDSTATSVLTGDAIKFGFGSPEPFEFVFKITGGSLAGLFGGSGGTVGVILSQMGLTSTANGFAGTGAAVADTAPTPEPGTLLMLATAAGLLAARRAFRN